MKGFSLFLLQTESNIVIVHFIEILVNMYLPSEPFKIGIPEPNLQISLPLVWKAEFLVDLQTGCWTTPLFTCERRVMMDSGTLPFHVSA